MFSAVLFKNNSDHDVSLYELIALQWDDLGNNVLFFSNSLNCGQIK